MGYLNQSELGAEVSTWAFFLNPVFYYSRGVSTKLAKALSWGLPVITTSIGCRGYQWEKGDPIFAEDVNDFAYKIMELSSNYETLDKAKLQIMEMVKSMSDLNKISKKLEFFLKSIW